MTTLKTPILTIILSAVSAIIQTCLISFISYNITGKFDLAVSLLSFFITFIISFFAIYYLFNQIIFKKIDKLYLLVKAQQPKEIPNTEFQLDEVDSIDRLEEEIIKLAQERYKEAEQTKNLDSYRKEYLGNVSHELKLPFLTYKAIFQLLLMAVLMIHL